MAVTMIVSKPEYSLPNNVTGSSEKSQVRQYLDFCTSYFQSSFGCKSAAKTQTLPNWRLSITSEYDTDLDGLCGLLLTYCSSTVYSSK